MASTMLGPTVFFRRFVNFEKGQQHASVCFKTGIFSIWTQLWSKRPPSSPSLHFLNPTSYPSQGHVHPVACRRCFFPFAFFFSPRAPLTTAAAERQNIVHHRRPAATLDLTLVSPSRGYMAAHTQCSFSHLHEAFGHLFALCAAFTARTHESGFQQVQEVIFSLTDRKSRTSSIR